MILDILIGSAIIIFGYYAIYITYKNPNKTFWSSDFKVKGYAGGIILIFGGILYILRKTHLVNW